MKQIPFRPDISLTLSFSLITILSKKEENIIASHMFPLGEVKPNCKEAWIVTNVDKSVACYECGLHKWREKIAVMVIFLINLVRF